jgi:hypothetical protein
MRWKQCIQWIALGVLFLIFAIMGVRFTSLYGDVANRICTAPETASYAAVGRYITANTRYAMYCIFTWLCFLAMFACMVCGFLECLEKWIEKED